MIDLKPDKWYYLIDLGYDIVRCPGNQEMASKHLQTLRRHADLWKQFTTGERLDTVPSLIGCYYDYTEEERVILGYPKTYGFTPTLLGSIGTHFSEWPRIGTRV